MNIYALFQLVAAMHKVEPTSLVIELRNTDAGMTSTSGVPWKLHIHYHSNPEACCYFVRSKECNLEAMYNELYKNVVRAANEHLVKVKDGLRGVVEPPEGVPPVGVYR